MLRRFGCGARRLAADARGNVAILFGLAVIPIALAVGAGVDFGRALVVRERVNNALDAAALGVGSWPGLSESELKTKAQQFFDANYQPMPTHYGSVSEVEVTLTENDVTVAVNANIPTTFMRIANLDSINVHTQSTITRRERNIEVVLVLDTTGSMGSGGKMDALKNAANKLITTLFEGKSVSDTLKIGVVPFSAAVNIGTDKFNSGWLDKAAYPNNSPIAKEDFDFSNGQSAVTLYNKILNRSWPGCVRERAEPYELTDDPPGASAASRWAPYLAPDEADTTGGACNNYASDQTGGSANQRQHYTPKYNNLSVPNSSGCAGPEGPDYNCPPNPITALTGVKDTVETAVNALSPKGYTVIPEGLLWGWRVISPTVPFTEGADYDDEEWVKAIVLLTDGQNEVRGGSNGDHNESVYNAFGYARSGHLGNLNGNDAEQALDAKTLQVCNKIKSNEILLYTIGFQVSTSIQNILRSCATKPDMFYNSPSNSALAGIFQDIAQGLSELRIVR